MRAAAQQGGPTGRKKIGNSQKNEVCLPPRQVFLGVGETTLQGFHQGGRRRDVTSDPLKLGVKKREAAQAGYPVEAEEGQPGEMTDQSGNPLHRGRTGGGKGVVKNKSEMLEVLAHGRPF